jgi:hypothetical protein
MRSPARLWWRRPPALHWGCPVALGQGRPVALGQGWRWRGLYFAAFAAITGVLVAGFASATAIARGFGTGSASTGSVALNINGPAMHVCSYNALLPGDLDGSVSCSLSVSFSGSIPAYLSLTVQIQASAGAGGDLLYDGTNNAGLTLAISDGRHSYAVPTGPGRTGGSCPPGLTCWTAANDLAAWYSHVGAELQFSSGDAATFTLTPRFPRSVGSGYQGGTATVTLRAQAVQAPANPLPATCTTSSIGQPCPAAGPFTWS